METAHGIHISPSSICRIAKSSCYYPYKFQFGAALTDLDYPKRVHFSNWFIDHCLRNINFLHNLITSDESYFYLTPRLIKNNNRIWAVAKLNYQIPTPQWPQSLHVWMAMSCKGLIGPFFIRNGHMDFSMYCQMLRDQFFPMLEEH